MGAGFKVTVKFDKQWLVESIRSNMKGGIEKVANEALKDANFYARLDSGEMIRSSIRASQPEKGTLVWDTPYARRVYYAGHPSLESNPNASLLWAHKGWTENRDRYLKMLAAVAAGRRPGHA